MQKPFALIVMAMVFVATFPAAAKTIHIDINKMAYSPAKVTAHVGDVIEWTNSDIVDHSATEKNGKFEVILPVKGKGNITVKEAGVIDYYCKFHPNMDGKIEAVK